MINHAHQIFQLIFSLSIIRVTSCITIPLPGGRSIAYNSDTGVLRIQLEPPTTTKKNKQDYLVPPPSNTMPLPETLQSIQVRDTGIPMKGYGAFAVDPLESATFLGFYEGDLVKSRERLDGIVELRSKALASEEGSTNSNGSMDYVMSLDGGATFLDGYERAKDRSEFSPVHLNHADKGTPLCNCIRLLEDDRISFFTSRSISVGEELCFDYGPNFWSGRESLKC